MTGRRGRTLLCLWLVLTGGLVGAAQECQFAAPLVNKKGFRPHATIAYRVGDSPSGDSFPADKIDCVAQAFDAWSRANERSGLHVRFVPGEGGIVVRFDSPGGQVLRPRKGGAWSDPARSADGFLEQATIWLSSNPAILDSCRGVITITLHELGHLHGLSDNREYRGPSVMNRAFGKNDCGRLIARAPTTCDAQQALHASHGFDDAWAAATLRTEVTDRKWKRAPADVVLAARCPSP